MAAADELSCIYDLTRICYRKNCGHLLLYWILIVLVHPSFPTFLLYTVDERAGLIDNDKNRGASWGSARMGGNPYADFNPWRVIVAETDEHDLMAGTLLKSQ